MVPKIDVPSIPLASKLPMIVTPIPWGVGVEDSYPSKIDGVSSLPRLVGGYLNPATSDIGFRLLTTKDASHYYAVFNTDRYESRLCKTLSQLQSVGFMINKDMKEFIHNNMDSLVDAGMLMPTYLARVNISKLRRALQKFIDDNKYVSYKFTTLWSILDKRVQQARYEKYVMDLANMYEGYTLYFPAFIDFRGRIYRSGILHFHERDIVRSLICFEEPKKVVSSNYEHAYRTLLEATAYHHKTFNNRKDAIAWSKETSNRLSRLDDKEWVCSVIELSSKSKNPYQFISNIMFLNRELFAERLHTIPISMDASASAYQIMSYFLVDHDLAMKTNLLPSSSDDKDEIRDLYTDLLIEFQSSMSHLIDDQELVDLVKNKLTRKLFKTVFMPLVYGKTEYSAKTDVFNLLDRTLTKQDANKLTKAMYQFWELKYPAIKNLMSLVNTVGWFRAKMDKPVRYQGEHITTIQDSIKFQTVTASIYNRELHKVHKISMEIPTNKRDSAKTKRSTFANYIHQKDASLACYVFDQAISKGIRLYSVHDCFIAPLAYAHELP